MRGGRVPALLVGTGLVLASGFALAPSAWAAGSITTPGNGTVYGSDQRVGLRATVDGRSGPTQLHLVEPGGGDHVVATAAASVADQTLSFGFDTDCPAYPGGDCSGRRPARNGTWTVRLTGGATDSGTFSLRIPPAAPTSVRADATGPRQVVVTWARGAEPDLTGYTVTTADGRRLADGDSTCPDGTCRTVLTYDTDGPSTDSVVVRAERACPDCGTSLTASSTPVSVDRPAPAPPAPAPAPVPTPAGGSGPPGSGTTGGTPGGPGPSASPSRTGATLGAGSTASPSAGPSGSATSTPGTAGATPSSSASAPAGSSDVAADHFGLTFRAFAPKLGLPKLPPLPATGVALPDVAPLADGEFAPTLPFGQKEVSEKVPVASGPVAQVTQVMTDVFDADRLAPSIAAALLLLMAGAHLRRWLGTGPVDQ